MGPPTLRLILSLTPDQLRHMIALAALGCLCSCAVTWDYIDTNPVRQFGKRHIKESAPQTTYPTVEQVEALVAHTLPMAGRIIRLLAQTGMRLDEVCSLEWS